MAGKRNRKVPFNCYLSVDQLDALDLVSERERRPRAEIVREAVAEYLAARTGVSADLHEPLGFTAGARPAGNSPANRESVTDRQPDTSPPTSQEEAR